ncbi:WG repeat-containing protein [Chitinophaga qingshengii]|uniref:WG repeat-containing protein n=1 Tax=Chitinophaga qingshengii TaxID=1569794 RepID=A0ABR7TPT0_9BACT|nr:WG repeat-containing protein [Chitinophaga qingshengii]MBC9931995.1 WG repeat-containing protein [Chitinophaga qingshengii]
MRKTFHRLSVCIAVILCVQACKSKKPSPYVQEFIHALDGKSLSEARELLKEEHEKMSSFARFMSGFGEDKPKHFKPEEEQEGTPFSIPDTAQVAANMQLALSDLGFLQTFSSTYSNLVLDGPSLNKMNVSNPECITKEIYFHDGTKSSEKLDLNEGKRLHAVKTVDSVLADLKYEYPVKEVAIPLDKRNDKADFKGATLKVVRIKDNYVRILLGKEAFHGYLEIEGFNKDGKLLNRTSYSSGPEGNGDVVDQLKKYNKILENIIAKLDKGAYKDIAALQKEIVDKMPAVTAFDDADEGYVDAYFQGNVDKVKVHIRESKKEVTKTMMLRNNDPNLTGMIMVEDTASHKFGFVATNTGKLAIPYNYKKLAQISPWFFVSGEGKGNEFYRLDTAAKQLVPLKDMVFPLSSAFVKVSHSDTDTKYGLMAPDGQVIVPMEYDDFSIDPDTKLIFASRSLEDNLVVITTIYDNTGKLITGPYKIYQNFSDGLLLVGDKSGTHYFINPKGEKVINLKPYYNVKPFTEGLAMMENEEGNTGFMDLRGKVAIPFQYASATPFNMGLSLVTRRKGTDIEAALINTSGAEVVPFALSDKYDTDGEGVSMIYTLQNKKFDAWGKPKK